MIVIVPVTAMPKANARAVDDRKANTRMSTDTISAQLIQGT